jgi:hypothetical protein
MPPAKVRLPRYPDKGPPGLTRVGLNNALAEHKGGSPIGRISSRIFHNLLGTGTNQYGLHTGIAGGAEDLVKSFDPRTKMGLINAASMFVGPGRDSGLVPPREIGPLYHGTPVSYDPQKFNYYKTSPEGLFGRGMYLSDNPKVANSYAEQVDRLQQHVGTPKQTHFFKTKKEALDFIKQDPSRRRAAGHFQTSYPTYIGEEEYPLHAGGNFVVHEHAKPIPQLGPQIQRFSLHAQKLLHMDQPIHGKMIDAAIKYAQDRKAGLDRFRQSDPNSYYNLPETKEDIADNILHGGPYSGGRLPRTPGELYNRLAQNLGYRVDPNNFFRKMGVDALEYTGGTRIGGYGNHRAFVAIRPGVVKPYAGARSHVSDYMRQRFLKP